jgi:peptidoglycan-associated lipoprotein
MKQKMTKFLLVLCCGTIIAAGCAKKEVVKSEEPIAPTKAVEAPPVAPPVKAEPTKEAPVVKEETLQEPVKAVAPETALQPVYFDFDSYVLGADAREILKKDAQFLLQNTPSQVQIQGNCDERGSAEYNLALGENRAKAAMKYLITLGVSADRLSFISFGKEKPLDPGHDEAAWAKNRRDDLVPIK